MVALLESLPFDRLARIRSRIARGRVRSFGERAPTNLLPFEIKEVWETDQPWNRVPNPRPNLRYANNKGMLSGDLRNYLFISPEPTKGLVFGEIPSDPSVYGKVEISIKEQIFNIDGISKTILYGIMDVTDPASLKMVPIFSSKSEAGITSLKFFSGESLMETLINHNLLYGRWLTLFLLPVS